MFEYPNFTQKVEDKHGTRCAEVYSTMYDAGFHTSAASYRKALDTGNQKEIEEYEIKASEIKKGLR